MPLTELSIDVFNSDVKCLDKDSKIIPESIQQVLRYLALEVYFVKKKNPLTGRGAEGVWR